MKGAREEAENGTFQMHSVLIHNKIGERFLRAENR